MNRFIVYHKEDMFSMDLDYHRVAEVLAQNMEQVFERTNHIDRDWQSNPGILWSVPYARSTSVGDMIEDEWGNYYWVAPIGYDIIREEDNMYGMGSIYILVRWANRLGYDVRLVADGILLVPENGCDPTPYFPDFQAMCEFLAALDEG